MNCIVFHGDGERSYEALSYEQIAWHIRKGNDVYSTSKWDDDPDWKDKAKRRARS